MTEGTGRHYPIDEVAQAWLVKMRGEDAVELRGEFEAWLLASADHHKAYRRAERRMSALAVLKTSKRHGTDHSIARLGRARGWLSWGAAATAAALLIIAYGVGGTALPGQSGAASTARAAEPLVTGRGEIRTFQLADGSSATLDTDSRLDVAITGGDRRVRLIKGRVRLAIAKSDVPLRIEAGPGALAANFAELDMDIDKAGTVTVALRRGKAEVRPVGKTDTRAALPRDKTLTYRGDGSLQPVAATSDTLPRDWPDGWAEYRSIRLDRLVAEANRYAVVPIVIDGSVSAALDVSGRFHVSQTEVFAERIASLFDLKVERTTDAIRLRRR